MDIMNSITRVVSALEETRNNRKQTEIKCIEFVEGIPLHMQQIIANISRMLNDGWDMSEKRYINDLEQLVNFFRGSDRLEKMVMDTVTWKQTELEEETLTILQVLILRFINLHLPNILVTLDECDNWKSKDKLWNTSSLCENVEIEEQESWIWENISNLRATKKKYDSMNEEEQKSYISCHSEISSDLRRIKEAIPEVKREIISSDSINQLEKLKVQYEPYARKAEMLNNTVENLSDEQKTAQKERIADMRQIVELLEKNWNGELATSDIVDAERDVEYWRSELDNMMEMINRILVEV